MSNHFNKYKSIPSRLWAGNLEREVPSYTFIIPTYKRGQMLKRTLESIWSNEKCPRYDVIVVDDDNTKGSGTEILMCQMAKEKDNLFYYKNEKRLGLFGNWNRCYELARSEWCCFVMDDDEITKHYLKRVHTIVQSEKVDCLKVGSLILDENNQEILQRHYLDKKYLNRYNHIEKISWKYFLWRSGLPPGGMCIKKKVVKDLGGYDENYYPGGDFEFDTRLVEKYRVALLWEKLCITHTEVSTSKKPETIKESIPTGYLIAKKAYNEIFHLNGKYDWIAHTRAWIALESSGYRINDIEDPGLAIKYDNRCYKFLFRANFYLHRFRQTFL